jgi:thioredoxin 1
MDEELEKIKKKKLEQLKKEYMKGEKKMNENMPDIPIEMSDADINEHLQKYNMVVIDCWAPWCGPCRMIHPIIEELAKEKQGEIVFGRLNVDENKQTAMKYQIMSIPSLLVFKEGKLVDKIVGAMPKGVLKPKIEQYQ